MESDFHGIMSDEEDTRILLSQNEASHSMEPPPPLPPGLDLHLPSNTRPGEEVQDTEDSNSSPQCFVILASLIAAIGGVLFGYDVGIISGALLQLKTEFQLSCFEREMIVSSMLIGALFAALSGGFFIDWFGRKKSIIITAILFMCAAIILAFSNTYSVIIAGRLMVGFAVSLSAISECIYISEISQSSHRGRLVSLNELGITLGFLLAYFVNYLFSEKEDGWRYMFGLSAIPAAVQFTGMVLLPPTPHYLLMRRKEEQAEKVLKKLRQQSDVRQELKNIRVSLAAEKHQTCWSVCGSADNMRGRMLIGLGLVFFQQFTGQPNVLYYASVVFELVGFCGTASSTLATVGLGVVKFIATCLCLSVIDRLGRRISLILGVSSMFLSIILLGAFAILDDSIHGATVESMCVKSVMNDKHLWHPVNLTSESLERGNLSLYPVLPTPVAYLHQDDLLDGVRFNVLPLEHSQVYPNKNHTDETESGCRVTKLATGFRYVALLALMAYVAAYAFGFGPVTWVILSEIFPTNIKGRAMAFATSLNWAANLLISSTFLQFLNLLTVGGVFISYAVFCLVALVFIFLIVPETKNKSLHQISQGFRNNTTCDRMAGNIRSLPFCPHTTWFRRVFGRYTAVRVEHDHAPETLLESTTI